MGRLLLLSMIMGCLSIQAQECPTVGTEQSFCQGFDSKTKEIIYPKVGDLEAPEGVSWFSELTGGTALDATAEITVSGTYYAAFEGCTSRQAVNVGSGVQPVAGKTSFIQLCSNAGEVDIQTLIESLNDGRASQPGGYFKGTGVFSEGVIFNPAEDPEGRYTYVKPSVDGICENDDTFVNIRIVPAPNPGQNATAELAAGDYTVDLFSYLGDAADSDGTWSPVLVSGTGVFNPSKDAAGTYTYTVDNSEYFSQEQVTKTCTESATVEVSILPLPTGNVTICHKGKSMEVNADALVAHLNHGDSEGACGESSTSKTVVYPNPSRGIFNFNNGSAEISQIRILDLKGKLKKVFNAGNSSGLLEIDLSELKKGMYFAEIITPHGKQVERLVKK